MANTKLAVFNNDAQSAFIDMRSESLSGFGRQVVVFGDPVSGNAVASVQATDPASNIEGVVVRDVNTSAIAAFLGSTLTVQLKAGTLAVSLDPGHLLGSVTANAGTGTFTVGFDPGHELGSIKGINSSVNVQFDPGHTLGKVDAGLGTFNVQLDPGHTIGNIGSLNSIATTVTVIFDPGHELGSIKGNNNTLTVFLPDTGHTIGKVDAGTGTFQVFLPDTGHEIGTIRGNTNTLTVFLPDTGHELGSIRGITNSINVYLGATAGTLIIKPDPAGTYFTNAASTASIFTVSGSTSGISVSGVQLVAPSASYNFKVFAFSLTTTAQAQIVMRFTNGAGTSPTEFWRVGAQAPSQGMAGANLAVSPPGYLFATGTNVTLALLLDTASLVHYSVSYIKESA